jgi:hypothetical protein
LKTTTVIQPGPLAPDLLEALEDSESVARDLELDSGSVRPCIGTILCNGVSESRQPSLHAAAIDLYKRHGLSLGAVERALRQANNLCTPPLPVSEIRKVIRGLERRTVWPYSCRHALLAAFCIGEECPHAKGAGAWKGSTVSANGLTCSGWLPLLSGAEVKTFLGLYRLARLKGRGPLTSIPFTFAELERHSNVKRGHLRETLERLRHNGLIAEVHFSNEKGKASSFRFPAVLPEPKPSVNNRGK